MENTPENKVETPEAPAISQEGVPEGMMLVNEEKFNNLMERVERVEKASDQNKLDSVDRQNEGPITYTVRLAVWAGKVVLGWESLKVNEVGRTPQGAKFENQVMVLVTEDGEKPEVAYINWVQQKTGMDAQIVSRSKKDSEPADMEELEVLADNGKTYKIRAKFVNA